MANYRKTRNLKRELGELDRREKDYMENLANSLLKIQNADFPQKTEGLENEKRPLLKRVRMNDKKEVNHGSGLYRQ